MKKTIISATGCALLVLAYAGCGSGTEPLQAIQPATVTPALNLPIADASVTSFTAYNTSGTGTPNDGFDLFVGISQSVLSPADGVVVYVDNTTGSAIVTVMHNVHLTTRMSQLQTTNVQVGTLVHQGSSIGISSPSTAKFHFSVYVDGNVVCPYSYLTSAEQRVVNNHGVVAPCQ